MNKFKRVLAMFLVLVFALGFMPVPNARAAANGEQDVAGGDVQLVDITANVLSSDGIPLSGEIFALYDGVNPDPVAEATSEDFGLLQFHDIPVVESGYILKHTGGPMFNADAAEEFTVKFDEGMETVFFDTPHG